MPQCPTCFMKINEWTEPIAWHHIILKACIIEQKPKPDVYDWN